MTSMPPTLARYLESYRLRAAEIAYVHPRGYRKVRWTYGEVAEGACRFARCLEERKIAKGDRVMIWGENCAEWVVAFFGCMLRGAVAVPMDHIAAAEFAGRVRSQAQVRLTVCSRDRESLQSDAQRLILEDLRETLSPYSGEEYTPAGLTQEDPVQIVFTSGTTADPKGVVITHKNILANLAPLESEIGKYLKYERIFHPLRFLNLLPLSHVFGQFLGIFIPQLLGGTVVFQNTLNPSEIMSTIRRERISVLVAVPRMLDSLRDKLERDLEGSGKLDRFRIRFTAAEGVHFIRRWWCFRSVHRQFGWKFWAMISGGAALDAATEQFWGRLGFAVIQGYGLTETTSIVSVNHPFRLGKGSIGQVLPGREIKLDDNGEIMVRGESIASAYYQAGEVQPVSGNGGWFHTGDVGELGEDGNLYFKGRRKNVIVTPEGMNIYPEDLELAIRRQPGVRDCVVLGIAVEGNAEPCAVLLMSDPQLGAETVVKAANERLAEYQRMRQWCVWPGDDFPRTSTQKPKMNVIMDYVSSRIAGKTTPSTVTGPLADLLRRFSGESAVGLDPAATLATDLQLSSIDRVELLGALEDRFQVDLNESKFTSATTVGELEKMLRRPEARRTDYAYPRWARSWPVSWLRLLVYYLISWPATFIMTRPKVWGAENLDDMTDPMLIICNHVTQVDIGYILYSLPFRYRHRLAVAMLGEMLEAMRRPPAGMSLFKSLVERLSYFLVVALFDVFPLPQQSGFRKSFAYAGECADLGYSLLVFPEGRRTQNGEISEFQAGIGMLAKRLDLPVIPMRIDGLFRLKRQRKKLARPGAVQVRIGRPVRFAADSDPEWIARDLEQRVRQL